MAIPPEITTLVFDWGDTLMALDPRYSGAMNEWPEVQAVPGIRDALAILAGHFHLAVATNAVDSTAEQIRAALARVGLAEYISEILTFAELGARKPSPAFFQQAARCLGAVSQQLVMVGDTYAVDIPGARRAGWRAIWYNPQLKPAPGPAPLHDLEVAHMAQLPEALQRLDLPDSLTIQTWYLEQAGVGNLWQHVEAVSLAAYQLAVLIRAHGYPVDPLLAHRGGLLHDIAKISAKSSDLNHAELGAQLLEDLGQPALAEIARRHLVNCLLDTEKCPRTWEEKIVNFADKMCEGPRFVEWEERLAGLANRYPSRIDSIQACTPAVLALRDELSAAADLPPDELVSRLRQANNQ